MTQYSEEAEKSVLGAIINDSQSLIKVISIIEPDDFYKPTHRNIFTAMLELFEENTMIDTVTLNNKLKEVVRSDELMDISMFIHSSARIEFHARIVKENSMLRKLQSIGDSLSVDAQQTSADAFEILSNVENKLMETSGILRIRKPEPVNKLIHPVVEMLEAIKRGDRKTIGIQTGVYKLDEYISGFQSGDLITIAARPSIGKTSLAMSIARNISVNIPVGLFSLEMSNNQLLIRLLSMESGIDSKSIRTGKYPEFEMANLHRGITNVHKLNLYIDDQSRQSILEIKAKTKRMMSEYGVKIIFIDYLQLMNAPKAETRDREIGKLTAGLKEMAKEFDIPVVILAQLSRATEARESKRPELSDLRESGNIEQDSDVVLFIHRPEFYRKETFEDGRNAIGLAEIGIAKHRNGMTGVFDMVFKKETTSFNNLSENTNEQIPSGV
jgi:replicative DNA helicase